MAKRLNNFISTDYPAFSLCGDALLWGSQTSLFLEEQNTEININSDCNTIQRSIYMGYLLDKALKDASKEFIQFGVSALKEQIENSTNETCKNEIESNLDIIILRYETGKLPFEIKLNETVPLNENTEKIAKAFSELLLKYQVSSSDIKKKMEQYHLSLKKLYDRTGIKKNMALALEKRKKSPPEMSSKIRSMTEESGIDFANVTNGKWKCGNTVRTDSFIDLFEAAYKKAKEEIVLQIIDD
ncbi:MAG: hypothetical protein Q8876_06080 [Bacillota bacterium]|nr:hypothetical protein [Bacillota bacterium]